MHRSRKKLLVSLLCNFFAISLLHDWNSMKKEEKSSSHEKQLCCSKDCAGALIGLTTITQARRHAFNLDIFLPVLIAELGKKSTWHVFLLIVTSKKIFALIMKTGFLFLVILNSENISWMPRGTINVMHLPLLTTKNVLPSINWRKE